MVVTGHYSDGSINVETITTNNVTGFDSSAPMVEQVLTVTIDGKTTTYTVTINAAPVVIYTVTFDKNGGDTGANPATITVESGGNVGTLPTPPTRAGYTFTGWNTAADGSGTAFTESTTVGSDITVYAQWEKDNSGGDDEPGGGDDEPGGGDDEPGGGDDEPGGGDNEPGSGDNEPGGSSGSQPDTPGTGTTGDNQITTSTSGNTATATTTAAASTDGSGKATAKVTQQQLNDTVTKAVEEAQKQSGAAGAADTRVEIKVDAPEDVITVEAGIPKEAVKTMAESEINKFTVSTPIASITFDAGALSTISQEADEDISINVSEADTSSLPDQVQETIGDRPVFNFSVTSGDKNISQFSGYVEVSVPYTPKEGEDTDSIIIYYINAQGQLEIVTNCSYDPLTGTVTFRTNHFSHYAVGYNKVVFNDVDENAWYGNAVNFIAAREITKGTGNGNYRPESNLTRAEFIVMVMRAYGVGPDENPADNFVDAGNTYYTYLAAAKRLGISNGTGNNRFSPDREITRQEMFTLLYNVLSMLNELPEGEKGKSLSSFPDADQVADWAKEAMNLLVRTGIVNGSGGGKLMPGQTANRAQMAQLLYNLLK